MANKFKNIDIESIMNVVLSICFVIGFEYYFFQGDVFGKHSVFNFILLFFAILLSNTKKTTGQAPPAYRGPHRPGPGPPGQKRPASPDWAGLPHRSPRGSRSWESHP